MLGDQVLTCLGVPMTTKFIYKMRSGGKWDVGSGTRPTQTNYKKKIFTHTVHTNRTVHKTDIQTDRQNRQNRQKRKNDKQTNKQTDRQYMSVVPRAQKKKTNALQAGPPR